MCCHVDESSQVLITLLSDSVNNEHFWLCLSIVSIAITYASVRNYTYDNKGKPVGCYGRFSEYCSKFYKLLSSEFHVSFKSWSCCILYSQRCLDQLLALHRAINESGMMPNTKHFGVVTVTRSVDLLCIDSVNSCRKKQPRLPQPKLNTNWYQERPTRCYTMIYWTYNSLNVFRAPLCTSSGACDYTDIHNMWHISLVMHNLQPRTTPTTSITKVTCHMLWTSV